MRRLTSSVWTLKPIRVETQEGLPCACHPGRRRAEITAMMLGGPASSIGSAQTTEDKLSLERHGGRTLQGVWTRICQRVLALALAIGILHNWQHG
jgi:hypothetical protein